MCIGKRGSDNTDSRTQAYTKETRWGGGDGQSQGLLRLEDFGWKSFDVGKVLGTGRSRTVFKAAFQWEEVAVKLCDL